MKKSFLIIASIGIVFYISSVFFLKKISIIEIPDLLASSRSKEFCSCYFLSKYSESYCLDLVKKGFPLFDYRIKENSVSFVNPFAESTSKVTADSKFGCQFSK